MTKPKGKETILAFRGAVNMTAKETKAWLKTEDSQAVGQKDTQGSEAVGHASGRRINVMRRPQISRLI
jgi:hypothetical protein